MIPLVSILIPAYNAERWIAEALRSAINQTWARKEILVVDDGSGDGTFKTARKFESKIVKVVTQENRGASAARNHALRLAQGDYIQWLDADDLLAPDKISLQLKTASATPNAGTLLSSAFGTFYYRPWKIRFSPNELWREMSPVDWMITKFENNIWMNPAVWLVSRSLGEKAGLWDERLSLDDDGEYFARVVSVSREVRFCVGAKSYYRLGNVRSLSRTTSYRACESLLLSLSLCFKYLLSLEDSERTRVACVKYLEVWRHYFCYQNGGLLRKFDDICSSLGGSVKEPRVPKKYKLLSYILGWKTAIMTMGLVSDVKLLSRLKYDLAMSKLSPKRVG